MNKYRRLSIAGSTIIIGLTILISMAFYFSITKANSVQVINQDNHLPDTVRIERIVEKPAIVIHDTVTILCKRKHCERPVEQVAPQKLKNDSL
jgi:hypothetical protein